jgi:hypothetical protein
MTTYKLSRFTIIFSYGLLGFFSLIGIIAFFQSFRGEAGLFPAQPFLLIWLLLLAWIWYFYGRIPMAITWQDEGVLEFKSLLTTTRVPVKDIIAIKATPLTWGFIKLTHNRGSLRLICQMTGFYELLGRVKAQNPQVEIDGC